MATKLYSLPENKINWPLAQEKSIASDYPLDINNELSEQYVARTYLQFLWLPQSIMPLNLFVPSLLRITSVPTTSVHPLHEILEPILLTTRAVSNKYRVELPKILSNGGGAGETEESMMWYALSYEKLDEDDSTRTSHLDHVDGPWVNEKWRQKWLDRMERREVQIQILLYMTKLSLPEDVTLKERSTSASAPSTVDFLEAFMDKLSMWQLLSTLDTEPGPKGLRDWIQGFCEEIVEPQFISQLPELCSLLRSKVFPSSPFSDDSASTSASRSPSPQPTSRAPSVSASRRPSPTRSRDNQQVLSRSRSLSVSLAEERARERADSVSAPKKRVLNREVSMSRTFKHKPKPKPLNGTKSDASQPKPLQRTKTLPVMDLGTTLVEETPVKLRKPSKSTSQKQVNNRSSSTLLLGKRKVTEEEDDWIMDGSPDVLLLGPGEIDSWEGGGAVDLTPTKPARTR